MPQVICPRCSTPNDTRATDYPFCRGCQDNLAKCGYCRWFEVPTGVCTHPIVAGIFEVSESATPPCVYHDPRERLLARRRLVQVAISLAALAAAAVLLFGLLRLSIRPPVVPEQADLGLVVEADYKGAVVGQPVTVTAVISNQSDVPVGEVRFEIASRTLAVFDLASVMPPAQSIQDHGKWRVISYPELRARERRRVTVTLIPKQAGLLHLTVRLVSSGNVFHGLADLPVIVEEATTQKAKETSSQTSRPNPRSPNPSKPRTEG